MTKLQRTIRWPLRLWCWMFGHVRPFGQRAAFSMHQHALDSDEEAILTLALLKIGTYDCSRCGVGPRHQVGVCLDGRWYRVYVTVDSEPPAWAARRDGEYKKLLQKRREP